MARAVATRDTSAPHVNRTVLERMKQDCPALVMEAAHLREHVCATTILFKATFRVPTAPIAEGATVVHRVWVNATLLQASLWPPSARVFLAMLGACATRSARGRVRSALVFTRIVTIMAPASMGALEMPRASAMRNTTAPTAPSNVTQRSAMH